MGLEKIRSYRDEVLECLFRASRFYVDSNNFNFSSGFMGFVNEELMTHPLFCVSIVNRGVANLQDVLISGGIHGEEPAGVHTILKFLEHDIFDFLGNYRFLIFPCINPFGFEYGFRFNTGGIDINRQFKSDSDSREASMVMRALWGYGRRFACTIDLHETDPNWADEGFSKEANPCTFYMWETASDKNIRIGDKVIEEVKKTVEVCDWPKVYGDVNNGGVIWYPEGCGNPVYAQGTTLDAYLNANYTPQSFTLETPCGWDLKKRIATNMVALRTILELKRNA